MYTYLNDGDLLRSIDVIGAVWLSPSLVGETGGNIEPFNIEPFTGREGHAG